MHHINFTLRFSGAVSPYSSSPGAGFRAGYIVFTETAGLEKALPLLSARLRVFLAFGQAAFRSYHPGLAPGDLWGWHPDHPPRPQQDRHRGQRDESAPPAEPVV